MATSKPIQRAPEWVAYDAAMAKYQANLEAYNKNIADRDAAIASLINRVAAIQARSALLTHQIEGKFTAIRDKLTKDSVLAGDWIESQGGVDGIIGEVTERVIETRFYVVTFVTDWGEESAPSAPSDAIELDQNDSVTIQRPNSTKVGSALAGASIKKWRIYRSNSGSEAAAFQFVEELLTSSANYTDEKKAAALGEVCPTTTWLPPPYRADLQNELYPQPVVGTNPFLRGLVGMPNGIMAGFFDNTVAFCEPFIPYAWPVEYQITTEYPIVGLGVFGQTLFVGTTGNPYFISGADSANMSAQKLDARQACASARSIVAVQGGVLYASPDGLCVADPNGVQVVTGGMFTREDWQKLNPASMFAAGHESIYYLWHQGGCLTFDLASKKLGRMDLPATAAFSDTVTDALYVANGGSVQMVLGGNTRRVARWKSAKMVMQLQQPMGWVKVYGDQDAQNPVTLRWFADGQLRHTATFTGTEPQRLPPGRYLEHEVEIESRARVTRVMLAGNTQELQSI